MESNSEQKNNSNEEPEEIILFEEQNKPEEERIENSVSDIEEISREEFLLECARYGDYNDMISLIDECKEIKYNLDINYYDSKKNSALRIILITQDMSAANGHVEIVKFLVENVKSEINLVNMSGNTALRKI
jgi:hypothetical protein